MNNQEFKNDFIKNSFSFALSLLITLISVIAVKIFYNPDTSGILKKANNITGFIGGVNHSLFLPESKEKLMFIILFAVFLITYFIIYKLTYKWNFNFSQKVYIITGILDVSFIVSLIHLAYLSSDKYPITDQVGNYFNVYQSHTLMQSNIFLYLIFTIALWGLSLLIFFKTNSNIFHIIAKFTIFPIIAICILFITIETSCFTYSFAPFHFDAVFYSVYHLNTTHQPMLVDGSVKH